MADDPKPPHGESREMYREIADLIASLAKAFAVTEAEIATGLEQNVLALGFHEDENGNRFVAASYGERQVRIYQGAIKREG